MVGCSPQGATAARAKSGAEAHVSQQEAERAYTRGRDVVILGALDADRWNHPVARFAREQALAADYIDNCWVRVAMNADQLRRFLLQPDTPPPEAVALLSRLRDDRWYVVSEEEF